MNQKKQRIPKANLGGKVKEKHRKRKYLPTEKSKIITEPDNETCKNNLAQSLTSKQKQTNQNQFIIAC